MAETIRADRPACVTCAARTRSSDGFVCEPWKLGASNNKKKNRFVLGRNQHTGTTMRPMLCPHPESKVSSTPSTQVALRHVLGK